MNTTKPAAPAKYIRIREEGPAEKVSTWSTVGNTSRENGWVGPLAPINIFVGANNSGKSRILRRLFVQAMPSEIYFGDDDAIASFAGRIVKHGGWQELVDVGQQGSVRAAFQGVEGVYRSQEKLQYITLDHNKELTNRVKHFAWEWTRALVRGRGNLVPEYRGPLDIAAEQHSRRITRVYLPTGRTPLAYEQTWEPEDKLGLAIAARYFDQIFRVVKSNQSEPTEYKTSSGLSHIISGQDFYSRMRDHLLGENSSRDMMARFQNYLGKNFFDGKTVTLIPKHRGNEHRLHIKIGDEIEKPAHLVGEGVSQIIIIVFALFLFSHENLMLFVEEPENYLHPGFQRVLVRAFLSPEDGGVPIDGGSRQVFVTTHSNHIIDSSMHSPKMALFHVRKRQDESGTVPIAEITPRLLGEREVLEDLGAQPSSVFLANSSIWVEGITDRMYIQRIIDILSESRPPQARLRAEVDYTIALFGGANLAHWSFAEGGSSAGQVNAAKLGATAIVVVDKDDPKRPKKRVLEKMKELGDRLIVLPVREIENLIIPHVLISTVAEVAGIAIEGGTGVSQARYASKPIGQFIKSLLRGLTPPRKVVGSNGQILDKVEFARVAVSHTRSIQDLSPQAVLLGKRLIKHVDAANGRLIRPQ